MVRSQRVGGRKRQKEGKKEEMERFQIEGSLGEERWLRRNWSKTRKRRGVL